MGERTRLVLAPLHETAHELGGVELLQLPLERRRRDEDHGLPDEALARLGDRHDVDEQVANLVDGGEPLEDGDEAAVLAPGGLEIDDVVVEEVLARVGGDGEELGAWGMNEDVAETADLGGDFDGHRPKIDHVVARSQGARAACGIRTHLVRPRLRR